MSSMSHPTCQLDNEPYTLANAHLSTGALAASPFRSRGSPSKKYFVELSAYLIKCNMDMSWLTCRLTYCASVPRPSLASGWTIAPGRSGGLGSRRWQRALLSNVKFDTNKCLHNDNNNLRNCHRHGRASDGRPLRGDSGLVGQTEPHPVPRVLGRISIRLAFQTG